MNVRTLVVLTVCLTAAACKTTTPGGTAAIPSGGASANASLSASSALRCAVVTPLPRDVAIETAASDVPERFRRFLGVWSGSWNGDSCGALAVLTVTADGTASVIYAWDPKLGGNDENPMRVRGRIDDDGELSIRLGLRQTEVTYQFTSPDVLHGTFYNTRWSGRWDIDMAKVGGPTAGGASADLIGHYAGTWKSDRDGSDVIANTLSIDEVRDDGSVLGTLTWPDSATLGYTDGNARYTGTKSTEGFVWNWVQKRDGAKMRIEFTRMPDGSLFGQRYENGRKAGSIVMARTGG